MVWQLVRETNYLQQQQQPSAALGVQVLHHIFCALASLKPDVTRAFMGDSGLCVDGIELVRGERAKMAGILGRELATQIMGEGDVEMLPEGTSEGAGVIAWMERPDWDGLVKLAATQKPRNTVHELQETLTALIARHGIDMADEAKSSSSAPQIFKDGIPSTHQQLHSVADEYTSAFRHVMDEAAKDRPQPMTVPELLRCHVSSTQPSPAAVPSMTQLQHHHQQHKHQHHHSSSGPAADTNKAPQDSHHGGGSRGHGHVAGGAPISAKLETLRAKLDALKQGRGGRK